MGSAISGTARPPTAAAAAAEPTSAPPASASAPAAAAPPAVDPTPTHKKPNVAENTTPQTIPSSTEAYAPPSSSPQPASIDSAMIPIPATLAESVEALPTNTIQSDQAESTHTNTPPASEQQQTPIDLTHAADPPQPTIIDSQPAAEVTHTAAAAESASAPIAFHSSDPPPHTSVVSSDAISAPAMVTPVDSAHPPSSHQHEAAQPESRSDHPTQSIAAHDQVQPDQPNTDSIHPAHTTDSSIPPSQLVVGDPSPSVDLASPSPSDPTMPSDRLTPSLVPIQPHSPSHSHSSDETATAPPNQTPMKKYTVRRATSEKTQHDTSDTQTNKQGENTTQNDTQTTSESEQIKPAEPQNGDAPAVVVEPLGVPSGSAELDVAPSPSLPPASIDSPAPSAADPPPTQPQPANQLHTSDESTNADSNAHATPHTDGTIGAADTSETVAPLPTATAGPSLTVVAPASASHAPLPSPSPTSKAVSQLLDELDSIDDPIEPKYVKQLKSDLSTNESLMHFTHLQQTSEYFKDFTDSELRMMSEIFSVLRLPEGEQIITRGENATFCGIVLAGCFSAVITPTLSVDLSVGSMVGEMSIFESMSRSADIITKVDSVLAVLTFQELDALASGGEMAYIRLQTKLLKMFAVASIRKLRSTGAPPATAATTPTPTSTSAASPTAAPAAKPKTPTTGAVHPTVGVSLTPGLPPPMTVTRESLYRVRLALENDKNAAHRLAEEERQARLKVEKRNQSVGASLERYKHLASKFKDALTKSEERVEAQIQATAQVRAEMAAMQKEMDETNKSYTDLHSRLANEVYAHATSQRLASEQRDELQRQCKGEVDKAAIDVEAARAHVAAMESQLVDAKRDLAQGRIALHEQEQQTEQLILTWKGKVDKLQSDMDELAASKKASDEQLKHHMGLSSQLGIQLTNVKNQLQEELMKVAILTQLKSKVTELTTQLATERKQSFATTSALLSNIGVLKNDLHRYQKILRYVTVSCFVKLYKLKKSTRHLHLQISHLLVNILEGHALAAAAAGASTGEDGDNQSSEAAQQLMKKTLQRKKKNYLEAVLKKTSGEIPPPMSLATFVHTGMFSGLSYSSGSHGVSSKPRRAPTMKLHDLLISLEEEVDKLKRPFDEVQERITLYKSTSDAFFQRSISLTAMILAYKKKLAQVDLQNSTLKTVLTKHNNEFESLLAVNSGLKLEIARFKNEIAAYKQSTKQLEVAADVVGARKAEMENIESKIVLQKAQLSYMQQRYVETVFALNAATAAAESGSASVDGVRSPVQLDLAPPGHHPHFPPPPPSAYQASPSMTQLLNSTLGFTRSNPIGAPDSAISIPPAHSDPEAHHSASLRHLTQTQHDLALAEFEKWKRLQFVLENQHESQSAQAKRSNKSRDGKGRHAKSQPDPLVDELLSLAEVASLGIDDNYASVLSSSLGGEDGSRNVLDADKGLIFDELTPRNRSRAEEEEAKSALLASPTMRVKQIKNAMGRTNLGELGSVRSNNNFHSNNHSRNSTDISSNGAFTSVGGAPHNLVGGGGVFGVVGVAPHSSYSSFVPLPTTSEALASDFSRTIMLLKKTNTTSAQGQSTTLPRLDGVRHDYATVYGTDKPTQSTAHRSPSSAQSSRSGSSSSSAPSVGLFSPSSYADRSSGRVSTAGRTHTQFQSSTHITASPLSPKVKRTQQQLQLQSDATIAGSLSTPNHTHTPHPPPHFPPVRVGVNYAPPLIPTPAYATSNPTPKEHAQSQSQLDFVASPAAAASYHPSGAQTARHAHA